MLSLSALRLRNGIAPALLTAVLLAASSADLRAQTPSPAIAALQPIAQADRIAPHPDFAPLTQLSRQLPGWVGSVSQSAARPVDLSTTIKATLILRRADAVQAAFEQLLADQQNPSSPLYHQWLTPQQLGKLFGPTPNDLTTLTSWLTSQGLKVDSISPSGVMVSVSGTAAFVGNAFHTSFATFDLSSALGDNAPTRTRLSAVSEPSIPSALSPLVRSIHGLAEVPLHPMNHATAFKRPAAGAAKPQLTITSGGVNYYFLAPADFATIYDVSSIYSGGNTGAKIGSTTQRVAIIGESAVTDTDITEYEANTDLPSTTPTIVVPTGATNPGITGTSAQDEATLDVDRVIGTAPGVTMDLVIAGDTNTSSGIFTAAQWNVTNLLDPIMTISFGGCEEDAGSAGVDYVDSFASDGAAEGITTLVSSGDSGVAGCDTSFATAPATQIASINFICSTTYVTCVGGTEFNDTADPSTYWSPTYNATTLESALSYIPEGGWNEPSTYNATTKVTSYAPAASGGGVSAYISKPTWQTGTGVPSGSFRYVPDVAFSASSHDGYYGCLAYAGGDCTKGYFEDFSGTSAASPSMAGIVALVNTKVGTSAGNINPSLYSLATSTPTVFHDATIATSGVSDCTTATPSMCNNSTPGPSGLTGGLAGFELTTGYDEVTGLGSIDVAKLIANISSGGGGGGSGTFSLAANPTTLSATPTASTNGTAITGTVTSTITATSADSFAGTVALTCAITPTTGAPPTCAVSPASVALAANGTAPSTLTITYVGSTTNCETSELRPSGLPGRALGGLAFASLILLILPLRKRRGLRMLGLLCLIGVGLGSLSGCGGNSSGTKVCSNVISGGTTAGAYTVTITGTSGATTATTSIALTIN
jgi:subtilase family serine protease